MKAQRSRKAQNNRTLPTGASPITIGEEQAENTVTSPQSQPVAVPEPAANDDPFGVHSAPVKSATMPKDDTAAAPKTRRTAARRTQGKKSPTFTPVAKQRTKDRSAQIEQPKPVSIRFEPTVLQRLTEETNAVFGETGTVLSKSDFIRGAVTMLFERFDMARENDDADAMAEIYSHLGVPLDE